MTPIGQGRQGTETLNLRPGGGPFAAHGDRNDDTVRCLDVLIPGKALLWFGLFGIADCVWSTYIAQMAPLFSLWVLAAWLLCGLSLVALCRWRKFSLPLAASAFGVLLANGLFNAQWVLIPMAASAAIFLLCLVQSRGMQGRQFSFVSGVLVGVLALGLLFNVSGLSVLSINATGVYSKIGVILGMIAAYAVVVASQKPLAIPVRNVPLTVISLGGTCVAVLVWFVLAEQDRRMYFEFFGQLMPQQDAFSTVSPLGRYLPDLLFLVCYVFTWLLVRTVRVSVILMQRSAELDYASSHDHLTALPNKRSFLNALTLASESSQASGERIAVLLFDLNGLKLINDSIGLQAGDQILAEVARRIRDVVEPSHIVARLEGDEFIVLMVGVGKADAIQCTKRILSAIRKPYRHESIELHLTASAGITFADGALAQPADLLREADLAITYAKRTGRNTWREYSPELSSNVEVRLALRADLQRALDTEQFVLHYQPIVNGYTGRVMGAEALMRWPHPERGYISPSVFVPLAEEAGLIHALSQWVLEAACRNLRELKTQVLVDFPFVVNVSPLHFQRPDFIRDVTDMLSKYDLPTDSLELEITEGVLLEQVDDTISKLRNLQALGIKISVDDFGTGYSSLRYLKNLPVDKIKIDRSFVKEIASDRNDAAISKVIISLAHHLNLKVVAEGVETAAQYWFLKRNFCDEFQGFLFARAMPVRDLAERLQRNGGVEALPTRQEDVDEERTLLLLDDEENILRALQRLLRRDGYTIYKATTTREAFDILAAHPIKVILSDQRLTEMTGTEFFRRVKNIHPGTVRIILSGYSDLKSVTEAINHGAIYKFLTKPWDEAELRQELANAFKVAARQGGHVSDV